MIPPLFEGQEVVVVAGGPSLRGFRFERLRGRNVIAINRAYEVLPFATILWWSDAKFWRDHRDAILAHPAPWKATCQVDYRSEDDLPPCITQYRFTGKEGFDPEPGHLRHGNNSTFASIHLAAHLGAKRIILLGVDMRHGPAGESHWHNGHGYLHLEAALTRLMVPCFESLKAPLEERGIEVLNANPDSALLTWPRCTPQAAGL